MPDMDVIDKHIAGILQKNGRASSAELAAALDISVSTASERVRRLVSNGVIQEWRGVINPTAVGVNLCVFVFLDLSFDGEAEACEQIVEREEVQELHHIGGTHSYLMKLRVQNTDELQSFLNTYVKPVPAVQKTETFFSLSALKETSAMKIPSNE